jgi:outer membrane immunogenic protein
MIEVLGRGGTGTSSQTDSGVSCANFGTCAVTTPPCPTCCPDCGTPDGRYNMSGGLFGGGATYNFWQRGPWLLGATGDFSWADISGHSDVCGAGSPAPHQCGTTLQSLLTIRGNLGYTVLPNWLLYGTAGYAGGELHAWDTLAGASGSDFFSGWAAGAGVQTFLTPALALKFEYLHIDLGHEGLFDVVRGVRETVSFSGDIFRVGLGLKFNPYPLAYTGGSRGGR